MVNILLYLGIIAVYMTLGFLLATLKKDNSIVDVLWGIGFIVAALSSLLIEAQFTFIGLLLTVLLLIWGLRLSTHIFLRNKGKGEDFRYAAWRKEWKHFYLRSFFQVFMLQGALMFLIVLPVLLVNGSVAADATWLSVLGVLVWILGFFFEAVGDYQLSEFVKMKQRLGKDYKGSRIMETGLWKYTRHPNYFGEVTMWWGIFLITIGPLVSRWYLALLSPALITFLILYVSGIPMLEKKWEGNKEFEAYKKRTSAFFPLPAKK